MRQGSRTNMGLEQVGDNMGNGNRLGLLLNNAFDVLGLRRDVKELGRVADFCAAVATSLNPDEILTSAARKFHEYFHFRLFAFSPHVETYDEAVAFFPGCTEKTSKNCGKILESFPGMKGENIRGFEALGLPFPRYGAITGFENYYELPFDTGFVKIVTDANIMENHSADFLTRILEALAVALKNAGEYGKVKEDSIRDSLTGLYNRRVLKEMLDMEDRKRGVNPLSLLVIDLDNFKSINDTYGHPAGDMALRVAAGVLRDNARGADLVVRSGGEEFAVMLPGTTAPIALQVGERLREEIENTVVEYDGLRIPLTASIGIAHRPAKDHFPGHELVVQADTALYQAKKTGKNKVCFYSSSPVLVGKGLPITNREQKAGMCSG